MKVEVIRSPRRRKTVQARMVGDVCRVMVPASMSRREEAKWVGEMVSRLERRRNSESVDLEQRAILLADRYGLPRPGRIRWVDNQEQRWGSCTPYYGTIRISRRLAQEPPWVLDAVIVHELAHLVVPSHGPEFWAYASRYPLMERARGFLIARDYETDEADEADELPELADAPDPRPLAPQAEDPLPRVPAAEDPLPRVPAAQADDRLFAADAFGP